MNINANPKAEARISMRSKKNLSGMIGVNVLSELLIVGMLPVLYCAITAVAVVMGILAAIPVIGVAFTLLPAAGIYTVSKMIEAPALTGRNRFYIYIKKYSGGANSKTVFDGFDNYWNIAQTAGFRWIMILLIPVIIGAVEFIVISLIGSGNTLSMWDIMQGNLAYSLGRSIFSMGQIAIVFVVFSLVELIIAYYMWLKSWAVPWIIAENPDISPSQAYNMSCRLTAGHVGELFVFELSFIGWRIVNTLSIGVVGLLFLKPYYTMACTNMYTALNGGKIDLYGREQANVDNRATMGASDHDRTDSPSKENTQALPALLGMSGPFKGKKMAVYPDRSVIVGRDHNTCNLVIPQEYNKISRQHCKIKFVSSMNKYEVVDTSSNGIYVGGKKLPSKAPVYLNRGTVVELANQNLVFKLL